MKIARLPDGSPEIFRTLQGEGPSLGCPAVFLRLSLCNLHCSWCDTPFTWNWQGTPWPHQDGRKYLKEEHLITLPTEKIAETLRAAAKPWDRLVVTGGEPLLQQDQLLALLTAVAADFSAIEIETNGTQLPAPELVEMVQQFNVSPKLANSGNPPELRIRDEALQFFAQCKKAFLKFVVVLPEDLTEIVAMAERFQIPCQRILLMPEGRTAQALAKNRHWLANECLARGYRLTDRLHVQIWGDERGR